MNRDAPWVSVRATPQGYAVRFGGGAGEWDFQERLEAFKDELDWRERRFDRETRTWHVDAAAGPELVDWVYAWFDSAQRTLPPAWTEPRRSGQPGGAPPPPPPPSPRPDPRQDAYTALWLRPGAPPELVRAAYRVLALLHHPDRGGDTGAMQRINAAFEVLGKGAA